MNDQMSTPQWYPVSAQQVLNRLQHDCDRWSTLFGSPNPVLSRDTPIERVLEAIVACHLYDAMVFEFWGVPAVEETRFRTVGELCDYIAGNARAVRFVPWDALGRPCVSAGVFLTLAALLDDESNEGTITPSSAINAIRPAAMAKAVYAVERSLPNCASLGGSIIYGIDRVGKCLAGVGWTLLALMAAVIVKGLIVHGVGWQIVHGVGWQDVMVVWILGSLSAGFVATGYARRGEVRRVTCHNMRTLGDVSKHIAHVLSDE